MEKEKEILRQQLELLAECSKKYKSSPVELAQCALAMCELYKLTILSHYVTGVAE